MWSKPFTKIVLAVVVVFAVAIAGLWYRCGVRGCPDVKQLRGYMPDEASVVLDVEGRELGKLYHTQRVMVSLDSLPRHVPDAFVAIEDRRFWRHNGVDWLRVIGAAWRNITSFEIQEGSSTITMQLARNVFPDVLPASRRTFWRKVGEARVAYDIEREFSKREILELYLNQIYFGQGAYGLEAAAQEYFGRPARSLTIADGALLAALPHAPSRLNPHNNPTEARRRRAEVLERMLAERMITAAEAKTAGEASLNLRPGQPGLSSRAPYFIEAVRSQLENVLGNRVYSRGYTIHTTLDQRAQEAVEQELAAQVLAIESGRYGRYRHPTYAVAVRDSVSNQEGTPYLQAAVVVMDVGTGDVRALIGGRDYADSQFNRATLARRQPGSAFKPFVYTAALSAGIAPTHQLLDMPVRLELDSRRTWEPRNYDGTYAGLITMRDALVYSRNVPTVRLALDVGLERVIDTAREIGFQGRLPLAPSVVLGAAEITPLALTSAYATYATMGQHPRPRLITRVVDKNGNVVWSQAPDLRNVLDPAVAYLMISMMRDVVDRGTGAGVRASGFRGVAAGKTGTTNDAADIWFVGFTPKHVATVWLGFDKRKTVLHGATGGELAAPLWGRIMQRIAGYTADWPIPPGVEMHRVDDHGHVLTVDCMAADNGNVRTEYFLSGTVPVASCAPDTTYLPYDTAGWGLDTLRTEQERWWQRLRRRLMRVDTIPVDTPTDTRADSVFRDTSGLLGRPVPGAIAPRRRQPRRTGTNGARPLLGDTLPKPPGRI